MPQAPLFSGGAYHNRENKATGRFCNKANPVVTGPRNLYTAFMIAFSFSDFLKLFLALLLIMDPVGNIPPYLSLTAAYDKTTRRRILKAAILIAGSVGLLFAVFGRLILVFFGITPGSFYIAGGILFFTTAFDMIQSKPRARETPQSSLDPQESTMIAVFPLAIPLIAGPGMITTIMINTASAEFSFVGFLLLLTALAAGLVIEYISLRSADLLVKLIGTTGLFVVEKIMGLILAGMSVQLVYEGLQKLGIVA
jgi:multiple antibiotic resistance protein